MCVKCETRWLHTSNRRESPRCSAGVKGQASAWSCFRTPGRRPRACWPDAWERALRPPGCAPGAHSGPCRPLRASRWFYASARRDIGSLLGIGETRRGFAIHKTLHVAASPERVFAFWADFENFPRFMSRVREVIVLDESRSMWTVSGPAGVPVRWTAVVTRITPNSVIEWCTEPGSGVQRHGSVRFDVVADGGTRVQVQLRYFPPAGAFGHALAAFFAADPKTEMDEDLMRMKSMIETGHRAHDAAQSDSSDTRTH